MRTRAVDLSLLGVAAAWGSSYLAAKVAVDHASVGVVLLLRYAIAALACALLAGLRRGPLLTRHERRAGLLLGSTQAAVLVLETFGVAVTSAAHAGVLISLTVLLTPLLDGRRLPAAFFAAAAVSVGGVALLMAGPGWAAPNAGDLLVLLAAFVRAGHVVLVGRVAGTARPLNLTLAQTAVGTVLTAPLAATSVPHHPPPVSFWIAIGQLAIACSVFAFLAQTWAVQRTSASRASLLLGTEPVWAVACALVLGGQRPNAVLLAGAAVVVAGTYWGQVVERRHRTERRPDACRTPTPINV